MTRLRWFQVEWVLSIHELSENLEARRFGDGSKSGFVLDRVRQEYLEGRYVERLDHKELVYDPFGRAMAFERTEYRQWKFRAESSTVGLELVDSPRGLDGFTSLLLQVTDFNISIIPVSVNVLEWASEFQREMDRSGIIDSMQIEALDVGYGVLAKTVLRGKDDVRNACADVVRGRIHSVEKVQLKLEDPNCRAVVFSKAGAATVTARDVDAVRVPLRNSLTAALR